MEKKRKNIFTSARIVCIGALLFALVCVGVYVSLFVMVKKVEQHNTELEKEARRLEVQESKIIQLRKNVATAQESQDTLTSYFIDSNDIVPFLETLEKYGEQVGVLVKYNTVDIAKNPARLNLELMASGQFVNVYRFIALLESAPYHILINSSNMSAQPPQEAPEKGKVAPPPVWDARMNVSVLSITGVK